MKRLAIGLVLMLAACAIATAQTGKDAEITAPDGVKLKLTYYAAAQPGPGVMLLHQCNRNRAAWEALAAQLTRAGFHVLALDYRGYGESGGPRYLDLPNAQRGSEQQKWPGDIDAAFNHFLSQPGVDKARIGAAGASCGVNNSIQLARRHPEVKSLVLLSGNTDPAGRDYLRDSDWLPLFVGASDDDGDAVTSMRWLMGFSHHPQNKFMQFQKAGHGTDMFAVEKGLEPMIVEWFEKTLRNAPATPPVKTAGSSSVVKLSPTEEFWNLLTQPNGAARAAQYYADAKTRDPNVFLFPEAELNLLGYERMQNDDPKEAIEILKLNVLAYPRSANVYDSLADAYAADGQNTLAIQFAEKAIEVLRTNPPASAEFARLVRESAEQKLRTLRPPSGGAASPPPQPSLEQIFQMPMVYSVPGMEAIQPRRDVVYKTVDGPQGKVGLKMDVYVPVGTKAGDRFPAVVLISGGGIEAPVDWRQAGIYIAYGKLLAASGFVGIPFNKRYARSAAAVANGAADTADLIAYLRAHAAEFNVDPDRIAVWGFSAGGFLLGPALNGTYPNVRAILSFYGVMAASTQTAPEEQEKLRAIAPLDQLKLGSKKVPPIFVGRAGLDNPDLNAAIDEFVKEAQARKVPIEVMNHPNGRHAFDILDNNDRSREIIRRAIEFLRQHLATSGPK